ncbi:unnamed protein product [Tenebrio molitor]|nr:unnamed protein product [Tenebrio molitor]
MYIFCSTLSEFENFLLCEMSPHVKTKRQANFKDFKPLRGSSNKKKTYSTRSCVNWVFLARFTRV